MNTMKFYCPPMSYKLWYKNDEGSLTYDHHIPGNIIPQYLEPVRNAVDNAPYFIRVNHPNVVGIVPDIEVIDGKLCGILKVTTDSELSQEDMADLQEALTDRISKWSIYFESQEIKTDGGDLYVRFYDSNAPILSETAYINKSYVENNSVEFDATKFYFNDDAGRVTMIYYNPDSTSGGQLVENNLYMDTLKEMLDECKTEEQFWDYFHSNAKQYLIDIDTPEFEDASRNFKNNPCDCSGQTTETIDSIRNWVAVQCEDIEQSQGMSM